MREVEGPDGIFERGKLKKVGVMRVISVNRK